jgi:hypothetical protein
MTPEEYIKNFENSIVPGTKGVIKKRQILKKLEWYYYRYHATSLRKMKYNPHIKKNQEKYHARARCKKAWSRTYNILLKNPDFSKIWIFDRIQKSKIHAFYKPIEMVGSEYNFIKKYTSNCENYHGKNGLLYEYDQSLDWEKYGKKSYSRVTERYITVKNLTGEINRHYLKAGEKKAKAFERIVPGLKEQREEEKKKARKEAAKNKHIFYKLVAVIDGKFHSIYDTKVTYTLNAPTISHKKDNQEFCKGGGIFCYRNPHIPYSHKENIEMAPFPSESDNIKADKFVILKGIGKKVIGRDDEKFSVESFTPIEILDL